MRHLAVQAFHLIALLVQLATQPIALPLQRIKLLQALLERLRQPQLLEPHAGLGQGALQLQARHQPLRVLL